MLWMTSELRWLPFRMRMSRNARESRAAGCVAMKTGYLEGVRFAQAKWAATPLALRLGVIAGLRRRMASGAQELAETVPAVLPGALRRSLADTLAAEVLSVLEACRFLEREAAGILRTKRLGSRGRPIWLFGVDSRVERSPLGVVLVIGAPNYPLFWPGCRRFRRWRRATRFCGSLLQEQKLRRLRCGLC